MEPADLGVILDSSVVIEAERQHLNVAQFLRQVMEKVGERPAALSCISVAELAHGIYRANTRERRERRRVFLDELKAALPIYPVTDVTAELVGKIGGESSVRGVTIPIEDLLIGACALEHRYAVATRNLRHFRKISGLAHQLSSELMGTGLRTDKAPVTGSRRRGWRVWGRRCANWRETPFQKQTRPGSNQS